MSIGRVGMVIGLAAFGSLSCTSRTSRTVQHVADPAVFCAETRRECLSVSLTPDATYGGARFSRMVAITHAGKRVFSEGMAARWARAVRMNLYARGSNKLIIRECEYGVVVYEADLVLGRFEVIPSGVSAANLVFVGAFDEDATSRWRFISAIERNELPLPEPER